MTKIKTISENVCIFLVLICFESCAVNHSPVYVKNGKEYGVVSGNFTGRWYDYYERGLSYSDGEYFREALADIDTAIGIKSEDKRWVNTYGMHFIDYFPHREKGIILYFLNQLDASEKELLLSMSQAPSEKAKYFLELVRTESMIQNKTEASTPDINIVFPRYTRENIFDITGLVKDPCYVSGVFVDGKKMVLETSEREYRFTQGFMLPEGDHDIVVSAKNLLGGKAEKTVTVTVDRSGPCIMISKHLPGTVLTGYVLDPSGLGSFKINDKASGILKNGKFSIPLDAMGHEYVLVASDILGNETELFFRTDTSAFKVKNTGGILLAENDSVMADMPYPSFGTSPGVRISLCSVKNNSVVYTARMNLAGDIISNSPIVSCRMTKNDREIPNELTEIVASSDSSGKQISFNKSVSLDKGVNHIEVSAINKAGETVLKKLTVIRQVPEVLKLKNRFALKIYPPDERLNAYGAEKSFWQRFLGSTPIFNGHSGFLDKTGCDLFQHEVESAFLKKERFRLLTLDYETEAAGGVLREKQAEMHPDALLISNTCVDRNGIEIAARMISLSSFREIATKDVFHSERDGEAIHKMAVDLSEKFHQSLPLVTGDVEQIAGKTVHVSFKKGDIEVGWPVFVVRRDIEAGETPPCFSEGKDMEILGRYRMGKNRTVDAGKTYLLLCKGDKVISK